MLIALLLFTQLSFALPVESDYAFYLGSNATLAPKEAKSLAASYQFAFVGGFGNELARNYMTTWQDTLAEQGIISTIISPHSSKHVEENIPYLKETFEALYRKNGLPLIVVGHSKGGLESVSTVIEHPSLVGKVIKKVVAVQSPLCACTAGDFGYKIAFLVQNLTPKVVKSAVAHIGNKRDFTKKIGYVVGGNGGLSLTSDEIKALTVDKINLLSKDDATKLSENIMYIVSEKSIKEQAPLLRGTAHIIGKKVRNDGLVAESEMSIPGFGKIIGTMYADHTELAALEMAGISRGNIEKNRAFILSVATNVLTELDPKTKKAVFCKSTFNDFLNSTYNQD